ncbi:hypothetical protein LOTGIDRAFT_138301, partial [Lottia gigantea]
PHGHCENMKLKYFEVYSPDNCQIECLTELTIQNCGCRLQSMPYNSGYYFCFTPTSAIFLLFKTHDQCSCSVACSFKIFDPTLSYSSLSKMVQSRLLHGIDLDSLTRKRNFLVVNLYYKELNYEQITQQRAYDIIALLCDIGGSMGLFIGASVMTMFEVIDLLSNSLATRMLTVNKTPTKSNI